MEIRKVNVAGIELAYERVGQGTPLVLIHGYPLDHTIWHDVAPVLADQFDLVMPDLRGFGASEIAEADQSILDYASDIAGMLDQLRIRQAIIAGHSMGGYVALAFAREFSLRTAGLALIASQTRADSPERKESRIASARQVMSEGVGSVVDEMTPLLSPDPRVRGFVRELISRQSALAVSCALRAMADRPDSKDTLRASRFPVVLIHGTDDSLIPIDRSREMKAILVTASYVEIPGAGHMPMMEAPELVAKALKTLRTDAPRNVRIVEP
jgi:pimeloyl-ACP methyl ester carboxylesterase